MPYRIEIARGAAKSFEDFPAKTRERLRDAMETLSVNPRPHGNKKLKGRDNEYRVRVGSLRIIYAIFDSEQRVVVRDVVDRKDAY